MARHWVGETGEPGTPCADPSPTHPGTVPCVRDRERLTDAVRRTLARDVAPDDPAE